MTEQKVLALPVATTHRGVNSFRITLIRKNASATPLESHYSKTKDLKSHRITLLQKTWGGSGLAAARHGPRVSGYNPAPHSIWRIPSWPH